MFSQVLKMSIDTSLSETQPVIFREAGLFYSKNQITYTFWPSLSVLKVCNVRGLSRNTITEWWSPDGKELIEITIEYIKNVFLNRIHSVSQIIYYIFGLFDIFLSTKFPIKEK